MPGWNLHFSRHRSGTHGGVARWYERLPSLVRRAEEPVRLLKMARGCRTLALNEPTESSRILAGCTRARHAKADSLSPLPRRRLLPTYRVMVCGLRLFLGLALVENQHRSGEA